ncbi:bacterial sugar transferase [Trichococcus palustris]|uniref:Bacterial sugar transferase n=1 Tax=Trichococcus palustris TaxID=140314 RepID=A0A143YMV1_9LACT|nr:sugar transferase [Trichococcus palustris]CZQ91207.1 bacterial sugar transferase [Trichococcus palustris]SFL02530.1 exopolysaccharide biosynthesis polyprenyl glycosylphosphotransferase [Trichococcus palustris]
MNQTGEWNKARKIIIGIVDVFLFIGSLLLSFYLKFGKNIPIVNFEAFQGSIIYVSLAFLVVNILVGTYIFYNKSISDFLFITVIGQFVLSLVIMVLTFAGRWLTFPRSVILINFFVGTIILFLWRAVVFKIYQRMSGSKRVLILGMEKDVFAAVDNFTNTKSIRHVVTHVVLSDYYENVSRHLDEIDIVYLASQIEESEKLKIYDLLTSKEKKMFLNTSFENLIMVNPNMMNIEDESIIEVSAFRIPQEDGLMKRTIDVIVAVLGIVVTSPIMAIAAILVKQSSEGPIFYKQTRITKDGKEFEILKFRSMGVTAEKESGPVLATSNDVRVTPVGKYLRSLRIDELPQLFNVLSGDMSLVGPRPERPFFVDQFKELNPHYYLRHNVRAGITGYAQVYGKYASDFNSKLNFDLIYIKKYSLVLDLKIMLQTVKILFDKVSSRGVDESERTVHSEQEIEARGIKVIY